VKATYRADIDGLRALAVVAVILNHGWESALPGGYLGVDVFFVISGFVITASMDRRESISLGDLLCDFYVRRIKRLVPALVACVVVTSLLLATMESNAAVTLKTGALALAGVSNVFLYMEATDYFGTAAELNGFTHTWSLGVEEQFYFVFPFLVWFTGFGRRGATGRGRLSLVLLVASVLSFGAFWWLSEHDQPAAYFMMPPRFWELAIGCLLFIWREQLERWSRWVPAEVALIGLVLTFFIPPSLGKFATPICVALTAATITRVAASTFAKRLVTRPRLVRLGLVSYSLYLWHWSVLVIGRHVVGEITPPFLIPGFLLMLGLAAASYRWVERPLRGMNWAESRGKTIFLGLSASSLAVGVLLALASPVNAALYPPKKRVDAEHSSFNECTKATKRAKLLVIGDSHARSLRPVFGSGAEDCLFDFKIVNAPMFPAIPSQLKENPTEIDQPEEALRTSTRRQRSLRRAVEQLRKGDTLVLSSRLVCRLFDPCFSNQLFEKPVSFFDETGERISEDKAQDLYFDQVAQLSRVLKRRGVNLLFILPLPEIRSAPELCERKWFQLSRPPGCAASELAMERRERIVARLERIAPSHENLFLFDALPFVCDPETCAQDEELGTKMSDATHLRDATVLELASPFAKFLKKNKLLKIEN
jgi:peptidoglycan/LPS O-acetylase OafA/YrhL